MYKGQFVRFWLSSHMPIVTVKPCMPTCPVGLEVSFYVPKVSFGGIKFFNCPSVRPSEPYSCLVHISYII